LIINYKVSKIELKGLDLSVKYVNISKKDLNGRWLSGRIRDYMSLLSWVNLGLIKVVSPTL